MSRLRELQKLNEELAEQTDFNSDRITIFSENDVFDIEIDKTLWSSDIDYNEVEAEIRCLYKGISLVD